MAADLYSGSRSRSGVEHLSGTDGGGEDGIGDGILRLFDSVELHDSGSSGSGSCVEEEEEEEYLSGAGSDVDEEEEFEDEMERGLFCRGRDGIHGDFVPLSGDTRPEVLQRYVPKSVKEAFDRYSEVVVRSQGFDCDPNLYNALPSFLKDSYYTQPVDIRDPQHFASLRSCFKPYLKRSQYALYSFEEVITTLRP
ncbi:hypothetical protein Tsubulata_026003 [Turnera subulata]|uniref:Uncharacterized protein n=1 Tax=Turnera subulata TaxID=218843 RepID=A0A9Q0FJX8_9ROSI|nr:hypothetical protein Tsubulata_026003 [Turnera subulata]